ncbi:MAG: hypothetical protein KF713_17570 [Turneriella sp.]|nr:hypothetical protein [Turneriella sp.]
MILLEQVWCLATDQVPVTKFRKYTSLPRSLVFLIALGCSGASTQNLLELKFVTTDTYFLLETESLVSSGKNFVVNVSARKRNINTPDLDFDKPLAVTASGTGTLTVSSIEPWSQGKTRITLSYTTTVGVGSIDSVILQVTAAGSSLNASSNKISVYNEPSLHHFDVAIPATAQINIAFNVTITAKDANGNTVTSFSTPNDAGVLITPSSASGTLTVTSPASGFVNGVLTVSASYNVAVYALRVRVALQSNSTIKGESAPLNIQTVAQASLANFRVMAMPIANNRIRLNWTKIPEAFDVFVDEEITPGNYSQIANFSGSLHYYYHTGLAAASTHSYRVTVKDNAAVTLLQGTATATTFGAGGCVTNIGAITYTTNQSWTVANSPYCITGSVIFDAGARLDIERGAHIQMSSAGKLTFRNGATFLPADTGSGLTRITSSSTNSPPTPHLGISIEPTASPTAYSVGTDDYANGSVIRHIYYDYGGLFEAGTCAGTGLDIKVDDVFFRQNLSGALCLSSISKTVVTNASFQNNTQGSGGGLRAGGPGVQISAAYFEYNTTAGSGGGLFQCATVANSFFLGNTAGSTGGGVALCAVSDSIFVKNSATTSGGAIWQLGNGVTGVSNSYFYLNQAGGNGGAIDSSGAGNPVLHSYFEQNVSGANGGAVYLGFHNGAGSAQTKNLKYNYYNVNSATGQGSAVYVDTSSSVSRQVSFNSLQEYYLNNATGSSALYIHQNRDATDTDNDTATLTKSVFKKSASDAEAAANVAFVLTGSPSPVGVSNGTITSSYFESGAGDCVAAFITGATSACATPAPNLFKTDAAWPFCASTAPGQATPIDCVGPSWDKPNP